MDRYKLPTDVEINGKKIKIDADYRNILAIFKIFNDPDLLDEEKIVCALGYFYETPDFYADYEKATMEMMSFIQGGEGVEGSGTNSNSPQLFDWEQDFNIIIAPVNRILGFDARGVDFLHWWTFLSAFMEIGECTFNTYVGIRDKLSRGIKLEKYEEKILNNNRERIIIKKKYDTTTQALIDEILGKG